jgi:hypothetical protein
LPNSTDSPDLRDIAVIQAEGFGTLPGRTAGPVTVPPVAAEEQVS